jgi:hypothetical protein
VKNVIKGANNFVIIRLALVIGISVPFITHIFKDILLSSRYQFVFIILPMLPITVDIFTFISDRNNHFNKLIKKKIIQYWLYLILIGALFTILHTKFTYNKIIKDKFQVLLLEAFLITILLTLRGIVLSKITKILIPNNFILLIIVFIFIFQLPAYILSFFFTLDYKLFDILFFLSLIISYAPTILNFRMLFNLDNDKK